MPLHLLRRVENINAKYRAITKKDVKVETVVSDVDDLLEYASCVFDPD